jgi:hypothetical protein
MTDIADNKEDIQFIDKNFLLQSPVEILPENVDKGTKSVRIGNITLRASETSHEVNGVEKVFCELPHTQYDRKFFYYLLKIIRMNKTKRVFKFSKFKLIKEISKSNKVSTSLYDVLDKTLLRWYGVDMKIQKYIEIDKKGKTDRVTHEKFRVISGLRFKENNSVEFEISKFFSDFIYDQKYLKKIDYEKLKQLTEKGTGLSYQLYLYLESWNDKTIVRYIENLKEKLGMVKIYAKKNPIDFVRDVKRASKNITNKTELDIIVRPIKEKISRAKASYTKIEFTVTKKKNFLNDIEKIRKIVKEKLDFRTYNYFSNSLKVILEDSIKFKYGVDDLINLLKYTDNNRYKMDTLSMERKGSILKPVGFIRRSIEKGEKY